MSVVPGIISQAAQGQEQQQPQESAAITPACRCIRERYGRLVVFVHCAQDLIPVGTIRFERVVVGCPFKQIVHIQIVIVIHV
jgi:hypothetical protein